MPSLPSIRGCHRLEAVSQPDAIGSEVLTGAGVVPERVPELTYTFILKAQADALAPVIWQWRPSPSSYLA